MYVWVLSRNMIGTYGHANLMLTFIEKKKKKKRIYSLPDEKIHVNGIFLSYLLMKI